MKKLFMIDYRERGISKHDCIEIGVVGNYKEEYLIAACQSIIGVESELDSIVEVFSDMSAKELNEISMSPEVLALPHKIVYVNVDELKRCSGILKGV